MPVFTGLPDVLDGDLYNQIEALPSDKSKPLKTATDVKLCFYFLFIAESLSVLSLLLNFNYTSKASVIPQATCKGRQNDTCEAENVSCNKAAQLDLSAGAAESFRV